MIVIKNDTESSLPKVVLGLNLLRVVQKAPMCFLHSTMMGQVRLSSSMIGLE